MTALKLYRKRIIPSQMTLLKKDKILHFDNSILLTQWNTLHPKPEFSHGISCYFLDRGVKISKYYTKDNHLLYWYCDIMDYAYNPDENCLITTDLLADVLVYPDGKIKVVDLDEMAEAIEKELLSKELSATILRRLNTLLNAIYCGSFSDYTQYIELFEKNHAIHPSD